MLTNVKIEAISDIRAFPASRKFPQFNQSPLQHALKDVGVSYSHFPLLAGRRNKSQLIQEEVNDGWDNQSFHNYADYTLTSSFQEGLQQLENTAKQQTTAYCCSERHPSRCHRLLISNCLTVRGWNVYHIIPNKNELSIQLHQLGQWGAMPIIEMDNTIVYPRI